MAIKQILKIRYSSWSELEKEIEKIADTTEKGDAFEQVCYFYFLYHKALYQIEEVFSPKIAGHEIPQSIMERLKLSHKDDGVDGVFVTTDGKYTAYQAKFRSHRKSPSSNELNHFWAEAEYADHRLIITNCAALPKDAGKRKSGSSVLADKLDALEDDFFEYLYRAANGEEFSHEAHKLCPMEFQKPIIDAVVTGFDRVDRGKMIAACATGKTLMSLWISERMHTETVLFLAPNLSLVRQTIEQWTSNAGDKFQYLAVCSDSTVSGRTEDDLVTEIIDLDVPVTTDSEPIAKFLRSAGGKKVIFSTYQSVECLIDALKKVSGFSFDLVVYDEAHRTAGKTENGLFNLALSDENVPSQKRLFMTATERLIKPWLKDRLAQEDVTVFSMDDEDIYGPSFYKFPFGEAIKKKIISDYKIVVAGMADTEMKSLVDANRYVKVGNPDGSTIEGISADTLFKAMLLGKAVKETGMHKVVSFHSGITAAKEFTKIFGSFDSKFMEEQFGIDQCKAAFLHINGSQTASERSQLFRTFERAEFGLLTNVRCLTEGIDMPFIDGIMFADPKSSMIDIVQAVGRALRKPREVENKTAYIIIPVRFHSDGSCVEDDFAILHLVLQALRDQDDMLAEWIDEINLGVVKGAGGRALRRKNSKIKLMLPAFVDSEKFANDLTIRIAAVNSRAAGQVGLGTTLGRNQRGSDYRRIFKSMGDYNREKYKESLVDPTLERFGDENAERARTDILVNNNNISHCEKLGVIKRTGANGFVLTALGKKYKNGEISFEELFRNQILLYALEEGEEKLFPYRLMLEILMECGTMNYIEFLYSVYAAQAGDPKKEVARAVSMIWYIRGKYPRVMMTSPGNQEIVRADLNEKLGVGFSEKDVWTDRTTAGNQYRFMLNHLRLFAEYIDIDLKNKTINVNRSKLPELRAWLDFTGKKMENPDFCYGETYWVAEGANET